MQNGPLNVYFNQEWIDVNIPKLSSPQKREITDLNTESDDPTASTIRSRTYSALSDDDDGKYAAGSPTASLPDKNNTLGISRASSFSHPSDNSTVTTSTHRTSHANSSVRPSRRSTADSRKVKAMMPIQLSLEEQLTGTFILSINHALFDNIVFNC
jgi:hypothetical protein